MLLYMEEVFDEYICSEIYKYVRLISAKKDKYLCDIKYRRLTNTLRDDFSDDRITIVNYCSKSKQYAKFYKNYLGNEPPFNKHFLMSMIYWFCRDLDDKEEFNERIKRMFRGHKSFL